MSEGFKSSPQERFRILAFDGGPSATIMIRFLLRVERKFPGFLERVDMFSGTSDGAFMSLYLAHALNQGRPALEALKGCIEFEASIARSFTLNPQGFLRLASGLLSMKDGQGLREIFVKNFGDARLSDLKRPLVSIAASNETKFEEMTYRSFGTEGRDQDLTLVEVAQASSALIPLAPAFRASSKGDLMLDGGLTDNTTMETALLSALTWLSLQGGQSSAPDEVASYLSRISLLSLGSEEQRWGSYGDRLEKFLFSIPWPPFGLQRDPQLYEYGLLWLLAANILIPVGLLDARARDQKLLFRKLLGPERFRRLGATIPQAYYVLGLMLWPDKLLQKAHAHADRLWEHEVKRYEGRPIPGVTPVEASSTSIKESSFLHWVEENWMKGPARRDLEQGLAV